MQTSGSSVPSTDKDAISDYLFQTLIKGNDCARPTQACDTAQIDLAEQGLRVSPDVFTQSHPLVQKIILRSGVHALISVLGCKCEGPTLTKLVNDLSPKLEEVFNGQVETLRPLLDILIEQGIYPDPDLPSSRPTGLSMNIADSKRAWGQVYQGTAHTILLQNIQISYRPRSVYANSGSIIQSSGYGKSRTVDEMALLIPTIPMNIRAEIEAKEGAFPPADPKLIQIFNGVGKSSNPVARLLFFFEKLFGLVRDLARGYQEKKEDVTTGLYKYFNDQEKRAEFYTKLWEVMRENPESNGGTTETIKAFKGLAKCLPQTEEPVKMVVYIDEAHNLAPQNAKGQSMFDHVLKATAELSLSSAGVFFLFLSTSSRLEVLASQAALSSSARFRAPCDDLVAPFTEMPFDCHPTLVKDRIRPGLQLEDIQKFSFATRFGRPLFWAYYETALGAKEKDEEVAHVGTLRMAQGKLVANTPLSRPLGDPGRFAILDTLLNLEYDPLRIHIHELASTMVASYMRTVYSVPPSRAYMHTGYPSEPVLAEAALSLINSDRTQKMLGRDPDTDESSLLGPLLSLYRTLDANLGGAIDKGERGENIGKMILLQAYTAAVTKCRKLEPHQQFWGEGCSVVSFLSELTGDDFRRDVLISTPDNIRGGLPLEETFKKSWVRFTHFARAADDSAMTSDVSMIAFVRGMAMIGWNSQKVVDVNIPILLDRDKPITESNTSSILVQFKVRSARTARDKVAVSEEEIKYFPPPESIRDAFADPNVLDDGREEYDTRPYISLVMELGIVQPSDNGGIRPMVVHLLDNPHIKPSASKNKRKPTTSARKRKPEPSVSEVLASSPPTPTSEPSAGDIHPRYSLFYYGCSHKVYQCIRDTEEEACKALLRIPTVFNDRPLGRPIDPVLQMKPFWSAGQNSYSWFENAYVNPGHLDNEPEDHVLVGKRMDVDQDPDAMDQSV